MPNGNLLTPFQKKVLNAFTEIEERLVRVTYSLMADNVYTIDRAIPDLIEIINLLELEHEAIMLEFNRILNLHFELWITRAYPQYFSTIFSISILFSLTIIGITLKKSILSPSPHSGQYSKYLVIHNYSS